MRDIRALAAEAKEVALGLLGLRGIDDTFTLKVRPIAGDEGWVALYRSNSQFSSKSIFWINPRFVSILSECTGAAPSEDEVVEQMTHTILHEYGHVITEWGWVASKRIAKEIADGWPGQDDPNGRPWNEEQFSDDFADWCMSTAATHDRRLRKIATMYNSSLNAPP